MALVVDTQVQQLVPQIKDLTLLDTFIQTADILVNEELTGRGLSIPRLTQIELFLAAHFATITFERGGLQSQRIGFQGPEDVYKAIDKDDKGFMSTRFGQQAVALDSTGRLAALSKGNLRARFKVVTAPKQWTSPAVGWQDGGVTNDDTGFNNLGGV